MAALLPSAVAAGSSAANGRYHVTVPSLRGPLQGRTRAPRPRLLETGLLIGAAVAVRPPARSAKNGSEAASSGSSGKFRACASAAILLLATFLNRRVLASYVVSGAKPPEPFAATVHLSLLAVIVLVQRLGFRRPAQGGSERSGVGLAFVALILDVVHTASLYAASRYKEMAFSIAVFSGTGVLFALLFSCLLLKRRFSPGAWLGVCLAGAAAAGPFIHDLVPVSGKIAGAGIAAAALLSLTLVCKEGLLKGGQNRRAMSLWTVALLTGIAQIAASPLLPGGLSWTIPTGPREQTLAYVASSGAVRIALLFALSAASAPAVQLMNAIALLITVLSAPLTQRCMVAVLAGTALYALSIAIGSHEQSKESTKTKAAGTSSVQQVAAAVKKATAKQTAAEKVAKTTVDKAAAKETPAAAEAKAAEEKAAWRETVLEKVAADKAAAEQTTEEKAPVDNTADKAAADKMPAEKTTVKDAAVSPVTAEKIAVKKEVADKADAETTSEEKAAAAQVENTTAVKATVDKAGLEKPSAEKDTKEQKTTPAPTEGEDSDPQNTAVAAVAVAVFLAGAVYSGASNSNTTSTVPAPAPPVQQVAVQKSPAASEEAAKAKKEAEETAKKAAAEAAKKAADDKAKKAAEEAAKKAADEKVKKAAEEAAKKAADEKAKQAAADVAKKAAEAKKVAEMNAKKPAQASQGDLKSIGQRWELAETIREARK